MDGYLEFIKYSRDREKLERAVSRDPSYRRMERDSYELIRLVTNADLRADVKEAEIDMCLALEEMKRDSMQRGMQQGSQPAQAPSNSPFNASSIV